MYSSQLEAYKTAQKTGMSHREIEAAVLTKGALMLKECQDNWGSSEHDGSLDKALRYNQLIWSIFQSEIVKSDNALPKNLKEDLLGLGSFIDKRIFEIMAYPSPEKLTIIMNINLNIAAGLRNR